MWEIVLNYLVIILFITGIVTMQCVSSTRLGTVEQPGFSQIFAPIEKEIFWLKNIWVQKIIALIEVGGDGGIVGLIPGAGEMNK